jgi:LruC domain-containing protein
MASQVQGPRIYGHDVYFTNKEFNPEQTSSNRFHNVLLFDAGRDIVLIGFEDLQRDGYSDDDFNDLIYYVTSNPIIAIDKSNIESITYTQTDTDNDGVADQFDDYPSDPNKAFDNYYPSEGNFATLAYEDLWPSTGDYDFNDLVINYNFNEVTNADNDVVEINAKIVTVAVGASFKNAFGFEIDMNPSKVSSVTGQEFTENFLSISSNGTESNMSKTVIFAYDNAFKQFDNYASLINTTSDKNYETPDTLNLKITLTSPVDVSLIGSPPYNPFIVRNKTRGHEIHLPNYTPTSKATTSLFGTSSDDTNPANNKYYKSDNNLPYALHLAESFDYPYEKEDIVRAYLKFATWVQSGGATYKDWYKDLSGYRSTAKVYSQ